LSQETTPQEQPQVELRIKSAADLERALSAEDLATRLAVLKAVGDNPQAALRYGKHNGRDLIDVLIEQVNTMSGSSLRQVVFSVLALMPGERVKQELIKEFCLGADPACLEAAGTRLAGEAADEKRRIFGPFLMQDDNQAKAREAAKAMADVPDLSPDERLRVALLGADGEFEPPALDAANWKPWAEALNGGPHAEYARSLAQRQGRPAFAELKRHWPELSSDGKAWLLEWGANEFALEAVELMSLALAEGPEEAVLKALQCVPRYKEAAGLFAEAATQWVAHPDQRLRRAAVAAGARADLGGLAQDASDEALQLIAINRLGADGGAVQAGILAGLLDHGSWRVRAAAASALSMMGEAGAGAARRVLQSGTQEARAAAAQALLAMEQDEWLRDQIN
jgi:hypothetical protein